MSGPKRPRRGWYRHESVATKLHVRGRWRTGPFAAIEALLPEEGRILDWGCGHGLLTVWAAARAPGRHLEGTDIDTAKLGVAAVAAGRAGVADRVELRPVHHDDVPEGEWDAVVLNDVLYLMSPVHQVAVVRAAARSLRPGGLVVAKELGATPAWKHRLLTVQERAAVGPLKMTATGHGLQQFPDPAAVATWMESEGLAVSVRPADAGYHAPHVLVVGRRLGDGDGRLPT